MKKGIFAILIMSLFVTMFSDAHPGRTDKYGCHHDKKRNEYHCHY